MLLRTKHTKSHGSSGSLVSRLMRILIFIFVGILGMVLLLTGYLYLDRDNIGRKVLLHSNQIAQGELSFEDIAFNPFRYFPDISLLLRDVAFATEESRVAAKGWLDFHKDSLDISFAVIDKKGCSLIGQDLYGSIKDPEKSKIKLISTLLAPVTNLLEVTLGLDCDPFYVGRIKHPESK